MSVIIQAGHVNIPQNCSPDLRSGTGAPDEAEFNRNVANGVAVALEAYGVQTRWVDANFNCSPDVAKDYQAVVSIHYQANLPTPSGFFVGTGDPAQDGAAAQSAKLAAAIHARYSLATGLTFRPEWNNPNITQYYLFEALSKATPFALIECGVGAPGAPDNALLWSVDGQQKIVTAITQGIADFLGVSQPAPPPSVTLEQRVTAIENWIRGFK